MRGHEYEALNLWLPQKAVLARRSRLVLHHSLDEAWAREPATTVASDLQSKKQWPLPPGKFCRCRAEERRGLFGASGKRPKANRPSGGRRYSISDLIVFSHFGRPFQRHLPACHGLAFCARTKGRRERDNS